MRIFLMSKYGKIVKTLKNKKMGTRTVKYNKKSNLAFSETLKERVDYYFEMNNKAKTGGKEILLKAIILLTLGFTTYGLIIYYLSSGYILIPLILNFLMGFILAGIGFNVMHDASHKSFSEKSWVNNLMLLTLEIMGACSVFWVIKHVFLHHSFVNIEELDDDIQAGVFFRMGPEQPLKWFHPYIQKYWPTVIFFYSLLYIYWVWGNDFRKYFKRKIHNYEIPEKKFTFQMHFVFWFSKIIYFFWTIILPWIVSDLGTAVLCYLVMAGTTGIVIALVFQLAHIVEASKFTKSVKGEMPHSWEEQQLFETINFQTDSKILRFYIGGLNHQIEHHLFPNISHVHYHKIQPIVERTCKEFGLPYVNLSLPKATKSHFLKLRQLSEKSA